jgi:hypothetical protein
MDTEYRQANPSDWQTKSQQNQISSLWVPRAVIFSEDTIDAILFREIAFVLHHKKLRGLSPQANYTDRATAACQPS